MYEGFFNDHPMLGWVFDHNSDGNMDFSEELAMHAMMGVIADEFERGDAALRSGRPSHGQDPVPTESPWLRRDSFDFMDRYLEDEDDEDDDEDDCYDMSFDDSNGVSKVDATDAFAVMEAVRSPLYDWDDIEWLAEEALDAGTKFSEDEVEEICERIFDLDLKMRLRCSV